MKKNSKANVIMIVAIVVIALVGVIFAGASQGWFGGKEETMAAGSNEAYVEETAGGNSLSGEEMTDVEEGASGGGSTSLTVVEESERETKAAEMITGESGTGNNPNTETAQTSETTKTQDSTKTPESGPAQVPETTSAQTPTKAPETTSAQSPTKTPETTQAQTPTKAPETTPAQKPTTAPETIPEETTKEDKMTCTIRIRCDTILDNMDKLDPEKVDCVPGNGWILGKTEVEFEEGDTVYDVLKRVCDDRGIHMEASWTPMYDSYYIEGINYLYEFDCGSESGWMYKVNGWFPNYGCSSYELKDGDSITWCYTCVGLGEDVGGSNY